MRRYYVYMLLCADASFYVGVTNDIDRRVYERNAGLVEGCYTHDKRPVSLVYSTEFRYVNQAIAWEKRIKGWSRAKKHALINDDWSAIRAVVREERRRRERP